MKHQNTIGRFYKYILNELGNLTDCGKNDSIFTGDPKLQVEFGKYSPLNQSTKVTDFSTAVDAIRRIVNEGEGSSPCNPLAWSSNGTGQLSHYFLFHSVVEHHELEVVNSEKPPDKHYGERMLDYSKVSCC